MEEHKHRLPRFIPLRLRWRFRPNVQSEAILVLLVPEMCRELIEDVEAVPSEIGEGRHRWYVRWAFCALFSVLVP
jgi:hypothetical protein